MPAERAAARPSGQLEGATVRRMHGAEIRRRREARGLSQGAFARLLGVDQQLVSGWELDRYNPGMDRIRAIDRVLEAGGQIERLYGLLPEGEAEVSVADLVEQISSLRARVEELERRRRNDDT